MTKPASGAPRARPWRSSARCPSARARARPLTGTLEWASDSARGTPCRPAGPQLIAGRCHAQNSTLVSQSFWTPLSVGVRVSRLSAAPVRGWRQRRPGTARRRCGPRSPSPAERGASITGPSPCPSMTSPPPPNPGVVGRPRDQQRTTRRRPQAFATPSATSAGLPAALLPKPISVPGLAGFAPSAEMGTGWEHACRARAVPSCPCRSR